MTEATSRAVWGDGGPARPLSPVPPAPRHAPVSPTCAKATGSLPLRSAESGHVDPEDKPSALFARLADLHGQMAEIYRDLAEIQLDARPARALMDGVTPHDTNAQGRLLSVTDLAERLRVQQRTIRRWRQQGKLPQGIELGDSVIRWRSEDIERWLEERER